MHPQTLRDGAPARSLTALTSLLLAAGLLAGCSQGDDAPAQDASSSSATGSAAADAASPDSADTSTADAAGDTTEWTYEGVAGKTALDLLLESDPSAVVQGEGASAFVTAIDGRVAQDSAKEFWGLYVNGEMAQVGAGTLVTETGDEITWKLETY